MDRPKKLNLEKIIALVSILVAVVCFIWFFVSLCKGIMSYDVYSPIELDTAEKEEYYTQIFHIKDTGNIGSYTAYFHEGLMTVILNDVKDIHTLCFENLAYYGFTEAECSAIIETDEEYKKILNTAPEERESGYSKTPDDNFEGTRYFAWISAEYKYWEIKFEDKSDEHTITVRRNPDNTLRCEINTGWGRDYRKIMETLKKKEG